MQGAWSLAFDQDELDDGGRRGRSMDSISDSESDEHSAAAAGAALKFGTPEQLGVLELQTFHTLPLSAMQPLPQPPTLNIDSMSPVLLHSKKQPHHPHHHGGHRHASSRHGGQHHHAAAGQQHGHAAHQSRHDPSAALEDLAAMAQRFKPPPGSGLPQLLVAAGHRHHQQHHLHSHGGKLDLDQHLQRLAAWGPSHELMSAAAWFDTAAQGTMRDLGEQQRAALEQLQQQAQGLLGGLQIGSNLVAVSLLACCRDNVQCTAA